MNVRDFLTEVIPIENRDLKRILEHECWVDTFRQDEFINEAGKVDQYIRVLISGAVRGYIADKRGKEATTIFIMHPGEVIAGSRMLDGSASEIGFRAIQDSETFTIPVDTVISLRTQYQEIIDLQMMMLAQAAAYHWETKKMLYLKTAKEKYEWFLEHYPGLIDSVNHYDVASFLNITPVILVNVSDFLTSAPESV